MSGYDDYVEVASQVGKPNSDLGREVRGAVRSGLGLNQPPLHMTSAGKSPEERLSDLGERALTVIPTAAALRAAPKTTTVVGGVLGLFNWGQEKVQQVTGRASEAKEQIQSRFAGGGDLPAPKSRGRDDGVRALPAEVAPSGAQFRSEPIALASSAPAAAVTTAITTTVALTRDFSIAAAPVVQETALQALSRDANSRDVTAHTADGGTGYGGRFDAETYKKMQASFAAPKGPEPSP
jgi:hypothetical protein